MFALIFAVLLPTFTLYCKIRSRDVTTSTLGVIYHAMANVRYTKCQDSLFYRSEDIDGFQILQNGHVTQATPIFGDFFHMDTKGIFAHKLRSMLLYIFKRY